MILKCMVNIWKRKKYNKTQIGDQNWIENGNVSIIMFYLHDI